MLSAVVHENASEKLAALFDPVYYESVDHFRRYHCWCVLGYSYTAVREKHSLFGAMAVKHLGLFFAHCFFEMVNASGHQLHGNIKKLIDPLSCGRIEDVIKNMALRNNLWVKR